MFFGESMFSGASGSKIALAALASTLHGWGWALIDAQVENPHLLRMGAEHLRARRSCSTSATRCAMTAVKARGRRRSDA